MSYTFHAPYIKGIKDVLKSGYKDNYLHEGILVSIRNFEKAILDVRTRIYGENTTDKEKEEKIHSILGHLPTTLNGSDYSLYVPEYPEFGSDFPAYLVLRGDNNKRYIVGNYTLYCNNSKKISLTSPGWSGVNPLRIEPISQEMEDDLKKGPKKQFDDPVKEYGHSMGSIGEVLKQVGLSLIGHANSGNSPMIGFGTVPMTGPSYSSGFSGNSYAPPFQAKRSDPFLGSLNIAPSSIGHGNTSFSKERVRELLMADKEKRMFTWFDRMRNGGISSIKRFDEMIEKIATPIYSQAKSQNPSMPTSPIWHEIENQSLAAGYIVSNCNQFKKQVKTENSRCVHTGDCDKYRGSARGGCMYHEIMPRT